MVMDVDKAGKDDPVPGKLIVVGDAAEIDPESFAQMQQIAARGPAGARWAAYQNHAMDSANCGHLVFLRVGEGCTLKVPPPRAPDGSWGTGWKYLYVGTVDLVARRIGETPFVLR